MPHLAGDNSPRDRTRTRGCEENLSSMNIADLWYKDSIIYELDVETFQDSNGDGVGDFPGLMQRLDYLSALGVNCLWLLPFFPSPSRDNGYDIKDFYGVDPRLGSLGDFVAFMHMARQNGIRVLADLVINHTSNEHPWFQAARHRDSPFHEWYIWSYDEPKDIHQGVVFPGFQDRVWTYDEVAEAWYFHRFFSFQPDLNIANPAVREEIRKIIGFWLELGVSGFRVDAVPFIVEQPGVERELLELRKFLSWRRGDAIMLAEANVPEDQIPYYFGDGARMHMLFNFLVNQRLFLSLARQRAEPLKHQLQTLPEIPETGQWAQFLRNHDECDLGRLSEDERKEVFQVFAPDASMQLYQRGIRRRLAPMFNGDRRRIELAYSLLFSLPGTPVIRYGDEIGMGDDLSLPGRSSLRTPMQWSSDHYGGFSTADPSTYPRPMIADGPYGYPRVHVAGQRRERDSLLSWIQSLIRVRKECPEFGRGSLELIDVDHPAVLAHRCRSSSGAVLALHNLCEKPARVRVELRQDVEYLVELLGEDPHRQLPSHTVIDLPAYGYRWYRVGGVGWKLP